MVGSKTGWPLFARAGIAPLVKAARTMIMIREAIAILCIFALVFAVLVWTGMLMGAL